MDFFHEFLVLSLLLPAFSHLFAEALAFVLSQLLLVFHGLQVRLADLLPNLEIHIAFPLARHDAVLNLLPQYLFDRFVFPLLRCPLIDRTRRTF